MSFRSLLLGLGVLLVLAGFALTVAWFNQMNAPAPVEPPKLEVNLPSILIAAHNIPPGTLLRPADVNWKQVSPSEVRSGFLVQSQTSEGDYMGAITRREIASGAALTTNDFVKVSDQRFLAATLTRGSRAVSLSFEAPQAGAGLSSSSALAQPGDHVDVILTQQLETPGDPGRRLLGETVLRDLRVIAVDRSFGGGGLKTPLDEPRPARGEVSVGPRTVTLEVTELQAQALFVAAQLGKLHLSVRPALDSVLSDIEERRAPHATWAADVSPALLDLPARTANASTGSTIESSIRRLPGPVH